jgi:hypothetical protein
VDIGDGEIEHELVMERVSAKSADSECATVRLAELVARAQIGAVGPLRRGDVPERMVVRRRDDCSTGERYVDKVLVTLTNDESLNVVRTGRTRSRVGRENLVANPDLVDGPLGAVGKQYWSVAVEAVTGFSNPGGLSPPAAAVSPAAVASVVAATSPFAPFSRT